MIYVTKVSASAERAMVLENDEISSCRCACAFCDEQASETVVVKKAFDDIGQCFAVPLCDKCKKTYEVLTVWKNRLMIV
ncbi:MAG: hypothetical protein MJZ13_00080 [Bacteroidales bacterium]|nr:hypothetical protein [Bacteroidales bacterium]